MVGTAPKRRRERGEGTAEARTYRTLHLANGKMRLIARAT